MTMSMPPNLPGTRRAIPTTMKDVEVERLRKLLEQDEEWVLRPDWMAYLRGKEDGRVDIAALPRGHRVAAKAWLSQQRHRLYQKLEGGESAPDGWLESLPLYRAMDDDLD